MTEPIEAPAVDLDAIRKRTDAATTGPWRLVTDFCDCQPDYGCRHGDFPHALRLPVHKASARKQECDPADSLDSFSHEASDFGDLTMETAEFIAHARTDVPALLAQVDRLAAEVSRLQGRAERYRDMHDRAAKELSAERTKVMRLATTKAWTNEDGKRFMFMADIQAALGLPTEDTVSEPERAA